MLTTERRKDLARRQRCRIVFGWLNRSEKWLSVSAKVMKWIALIVGWISVLAAIFHYFGQTPPWLMDIISRV